MRSDEAQTAARVGANIRQFREAKKLSRPQLAELIGRDRTHVWRIEAGQTLPPVPALETIAGALGVDVAALLARRRSRRSNH